MLKILFVIHDLLGGGAEKVLINLVNNMDHEKFDITVMALFGGGVNEQFLSSKVRLINCFPRIIPGNSHLMKIYSPELLHDHFVKEVYDIEIAYLGGAAARIVSGCTNSKTIKLAWIHRTMGSKAEVAMAFRNYKEAKRCYESFDRMIFVSESVRKAFLKYCFIDKKTHVIYNTNESEKIRKLSKEAAQELAEDGKIRLVGVGKIDDNKGFDRLARIHHRLLQDGCNIHTYILGIGKKRKEIQRYLKKNHIEDSFTFLGYQTNPYKYVAKCDLFVCSSYSEGFSTAATEALIVETPVCTAEVSGMREMLGENNEYGIVTDNNEEALYKALLKLIKTPETLAHYKKQAILRGKDFKTEKSVEAVTDMLLSLCCGELA